MKHRENFTTRCLTRIDGTSNLILLDVRGLFSMKILTFYPNEAITRFFVVFFFFFFFFFFFNKAIMFSIVFLLLYDHRRIHHQEKDDQAACLPKGN